MRAGKIAVLVPQPIDLGCLSNHVLLAPKESFDLLLKSRDLFLKQFLFGFMKILFKLSLGFLQQFCCLVGLIGGTLRIVVLGCGGRAFKALNSLLGGRGRSFGLQTAQSPLESPRALGQLLLASREILKLPAPRLGVVLFRSRIRRFP